MHQRMKILIFGLTEFRIKCIHNIYSNSIFNVINTYHYDYDIGTYRNRTNCKIPNQMLITLFMALFRLISVIPISIHNCRMHGPMTKDHHLN